jgi:Cu2+-exporting ATPase
MCVAIDGTIAAVFGVADAPRETSIAAVSTLREMGVRVAMLTGDNEATAQRIAEQLTITEVIADVRPGDKAARVAELQASGATVAMVGDGVNDDVAIALQIGRGTRRKMRQNLTWAIGYNSIALPIAAGVFVPAYGFGLRPEIAALTMSGSSIIVAFNAMLLKRLHLPAPATTSPTTDAS